MNPEQDRVTGSLLGLAVGDALGTTLEFSSPGTFSPISDMLGGGPFDLKPGQWTDDTSMALCLAESLIHNGWDPADQMKRYLRWYLDGENSSTGTCFDIGNTVRSALISFQTTQNPFCGSDDPQSAGNGSLMRLSPIPLYFHSDPPLAAIRAREMSRTTHGARTCLDACSVTTLLIIHLLQGMDKTTALTSLQDVPDLSSEITEVIQGSYVNKQPPEIRGSGYVVDSLEAALWAFSHSSTFQEGALMAVNLGDDADTTGATFGQIAGAYYGESGIPEAWRESVWQRDRITSIAAALVQGGHSNQSS